MKKLLLGSLMWVAFVYSLSPIKAQTTLTGDHVIDGDLAVGSSTNKSKLTVNGETGAGAALGLSVFGDGGVVFGGTRNIGSLPDLDWERPYFIWYPAKCALRTVSADRFYVSDSEIGLESTAFGQAGASGFNSFAAAGGGASGDYSFAGGRSTATGEDSAAFAQGLATSGMAFAAGLAHASGGLSAALSGGSSSAYLSTAVSGGVANGDFAFASVCGIANLPNSFASVYGTANGDGSVAIGVGAVANGYNSIAIGRGVVVDEFECFVTGKFNDPQQILDLANSGSVSNPIFIVGNGYEASSRSNALIVCQDGEVMIPKRQGDILMGEFGNPE